MAVMLCDDGDGEGDGGDGGTGDTKWQFRCGGILKNLLVTVR